MIQEEREQIITNENNAQQQFESYLDTLAKPINAIKMTSILSGDIDLKVLKDKGYGVPNELIFNEGKITNLYNIPEGIVRLEIPNNMLDNINNLPKSVEVLNLEQNFIQNIDISLLTELNELNVSNNKLTKLEKIPKNIIDLKCSHNKLEYLDLQGLTQLKTLHISNNMITVIDNMPDTVENLEMENTPSIEYRNKTAEDLNIPFAQREESRKKKKDYIAAINDFFKLKSKYESKVHTLRKNAYDNAKTKKIARDNLKKGLIKSQCIKCKRQGGSIFKVERNKYSVLCGVSNSPCDLDIQIFTGDFVLREDALDAFLEGINDIKIEIIRNKLDNIFGYIDDETSKKITDEKLKDYNLNSTIYTETIEEREQLVDNKEKAEEIANNKRELYSLIDNNKDLIRQYKETNNAEILKDVANTTVNDVYRIARNIRNLEHGEMDMIYYDKGYYPEDTNRKIHKLYQYPVKHEKMETNYLREPVNVIKFNK